MKKITNELGKKNQNPLYQTPIKQSLNLRDNNNKGPYQFDFNFYFGNIWSSGSIPRQNIDLYYHNSIAQRERETNLMLFKSSLEKSGFKLTPNSESKSSKIELLGYNNILENDLNQSDMTKRNLNELFNNVRNRDHTESDKKRSGTFNNDFKNINNNHINIIKSINNNNYQLEDNYKNDIKKKNKFEGTKNQSLEKQEDKNIELFNTPINVNPKKIFECSGSTGVGTNSSKLLMRKRRFRKNNEQILLLSEFFNENKCWSKEQIKEISQKTGLKENKVYKWLWDQKNKKIKDTKFIINKKNNIKENN